MILQDGRYGPYRFFNPGFLETLRPRRIADFAPELDDAGMSRPIGLAFMTNPPARGSLARWDRTSSATALRPEPFGESTRTTASSSSSDGAPTRTPPRTTCGRQARFRGRRGTRPLRPLPGYSVFFTAVTKYGVSPKQLDGMASCSSYSSITRLPAYVLIPNMPTPSPHWATISASHSTGAVHPYRR